MKRKIICIDEEKCDGCGACIPSCAEGALQIINGKARLISDLFCDGLGACIGDCPRGAIEVEEREAEPYNEEIVMETIVKGGAPVIEAHLKHLREHNETAYLRTALNYLKSKNIAGPLINEGAKGHISHHTGCPGAKSMNFQSRKTNQEQTEELNSALTQWPVQMHLIQPSSVIFKNADLLLVADCCAYSYGNFHNEFMSGRSLVIACPKLDSGLDIYLKKLVSLIEEANINTLTVIIMEVPCCRGLLALAQKALETAARKVPLKLIVIGIKGEKIKDEWI